MATAVVVAAAFATHPWTLPLVAEALVVDAAADRGEIAFPLDGSAAIDWAAQAVQAGRINLVGLRRSLPSRLEERGLLPDPWVQMNEDLDRLGVPADRRWTIPRVLEQSRDFADGLADYLETHPDAVVLLVCSRYRSGRVRRRMNELLIAELAVRVHVVPVDAAGVQSTDWWQTRDGQRVIITEAMRSIAMWICGQESDRPERRTDAEFQRAAVAL